MKTRARLLNAREVMPEGPSILILKEAVHYFKGKKVLTVNGNTKQPKERMRSKTIKDFKSWGKHFLICFDDFTVRIHFMLFGSYLINQRKQTPVRLRLSFKKGELNFYACSVKFIEEPLDKVYDWSGDVLNETWECKKCAQKVKAACRNTSL